MKVVLCYIAVTGGPITENHCAQFAATYHEYPPGINHETLVICQGGALPTSTAIMFCDMKASMWPRINDAGWDVTAYIDAARGPCSDADMMVCMGESVWFHREGWLKRFVDVWNKHGPGFYGPYSANSPRGYLITTVFCCQPKMLAEYPLKVLTKDARHEFEYGENALWRRVHRKGFPVRMVSWDGDWEPRLWRMPNNILWRGDQTNCLMFCNHTQRFSEADYRTKMNWLRTCDKPFQ